MSDGFTTFAQCSQILMEALGIGIIMLTALVAISEASLRLCRKNDRILVLQELRQRVGRGILLGLEFLIGADIIHTVAIELTFQTVGILAAVVLIRTFLSFTLEVELTGKWPWHKTQK
jgi:uncharacterized membrane protein